MATGRQAGPVGSKTTSRRVPAGAPASAACSRSRRLSRRGQQRRRQTSLPSARSTRAVCVVAIPRSMPTSLRSGMTFLLPWMSLPRLPAGGASTATVPLWLSLAAAPSHLRQRDPAHHPVGRSTLLNRVIRGQAQGGNHTCEARRSRRLPQPHPVRHPPDQPGPFHRTAIERRMSRPVAGRCRARPRASWRRSARRPPSSAGRWLDGEEEVEMRHLP